MKQTPSFKKQHLNKHLFKNKITIFNKHLKQALLCQKSKHVLMPA